MSPTTITASSPNAVTKDEDEPSARGPASTDADGAHPFASIADGEGEGCAWGAASTDAHNPHPFASIADDGVTGELRLEPIRG